MRYMLDTNNCTVMMEGDAATRNKLRTISFQNVNIFGILFAELVHEVNKK